MYLMLLLFLEEDLEDCVFLVFTKIGIYFRAKNEIGRNLKKNLEIVLRDNFKWLEIFFVFATVDTPVETF